MQIKEEDIISIEMVTTFYYKNCEVTLKKYNNISTIKIIGMSDLGNLLIDFQTFKEKYKKQILAKYLSTREISHVRKIYKSVLSKEYGTDDKIY